MNLKADHVFWRSLVIALLVVILVMNAAVYLESDSKRDKMLTDLGMLKTQTEAIRREYVLLRDYLVKQEEQDEKLSGLEKSLREIKAEVTLMRRKRD